MTLIGIIPRLTSIRLFTPMFGQRCPIPSSSVRCTRNRFISESPDVNYSDARRREIDWGGEFLLLVHFVVTNK